MQELVDFGPKMTISTKIWSGSGHFRAERGIVNPVS
jgi:hypothetical protein